MKFRYIGDSDKMQVFGYDFRDGATPEVTNPHALQKLSGNQFFEALPEEDEETETETEETEETEEETEIEELPLHVDNELAEDEAQAADMNDEVNETVEIEELGEEQPLLVADAPTKERQKPGRKPRKR